MRPFLIIFLLLLIGFEILILFPKQTDQAEPPKENSTSNATSAKENAVQQKMGGIHLVESRQGTRDWELSSKSAQSYQNSPVWDMEDVEISFYNANNKDFVLKGKKGTIDTQTKDMKIEGSVEITTSNGYIFTAPYVEYDAADRLIFCSSVVQVKGPVLQNRRSLFLKGTGMRIPVTDKKIYLDQNVSGQKVFAGENEKTLSLRSHRAELSSENQTAQFIQDVAIDYPPMSMTSNKATFTYNDKTKLFEHLDLNGKVELKDENRRAVSENLRMDFNKKLITFSGQPRLYQGEDELTGEQIVFIDNGKKVKVEKVKLQSKEQM